MPTWCFQLAAAPGPCASYAISFCDTWGNLKFSSLGYLQRFAFDLVKIDQTFVRNMDSNPKNREIIETIVDLANRLELRAARERPEVVEGGTLPADLLRR